MHVICNDALLGVSSGALRETNFLHLLGQPAENRILANDKAPAADAEAGHRVVIMGDKVCVKAPPQQACCDTSVKGMEQDLMKLCGWL